MKRNKHDEDDDCDRNRTYYMMSVSSKLFLTHLIFFLTNLTCHVRRLTQKSYIVIVMKFCRLTFKLIYR